MRKLVLIAVASAAFASFAQGGDSEEVVRLVNGKTVTRSQMKAALSRVGMMRYGGHVRKAESAQGVFVVLNAQTNVPSSEIEKALAVIDGRIRLQAKCVAANDITQDNIRESVAKAGGAAGVAVVAGKATAPALLAATEEGWAIVNVAKLAADGTAGAALATRVRREVLRAFAFAVGGVYGARGDALMQPVREPKDLDALVREDFAATMAQTLALVTPAYGLRPWMETTYLKACEQGWAPAPTNEYQKAIWDKVHAMPTTPLKIKPETKKVAE